ncbi:FAD-dependent oxidoreductase [Patescibacteria group bacterium]|nr:FAD-dependent oxidoreductase [Patescibacteria group bacterium]
MNLIRIEQIPLGLDENEEILKPKISKILDLPESEILSWQIVKKNIDSRKRDILIVHCVDVQVKNIKAIKKWDKHHRTRIHEPYIYQEPSLKNPPKKTIIVVGSGPCGLFATLLLAKAGLKPLLIERGKDVDARIKDVDKFSQTGKLNTASNIQFGEGGAGTFSDGKLYTLINNPRSHYLFNELIKAGAPKEIAYSGSPHIGTDRLRGVIKNLRKEIIKLGGKVRFKTCLSDLEIKNNKIKAVILNDKEKVPVDHLILATGHSARDTYQMLYDRKLKMGPKAFSIGVRIEHKAASINKSQYGESSNHPKLGTAKYKLVQHLKDRRPVYTFCMCPGGYVMAAASEERTLATNGMSKYAQDGENSNSALLVPVMPEDFGSTHPLAGIEFQRQWERKAYLAGGSNYFAPVQLVGDFLKDRPSTTVKSIKPSYLPGVTPTSLTSCLPDFVIESLKEAIPLLARKIKGFDDPEAVLTGVETRSSSTVRLERNEAFQSNISGIYPAGEGAGHAGGIVSSAIDGLMVAEAIIENI